MENEVSVKNWMSNSTYDALKFVAQIALPAVGTLYFALAQIWGIPYGQEVIGTITAIDIFLGVLLGISTNKYNSNPDNYDGTLHVDRSDPEKDKAVLALNIPIEAIEGRDSISLNIQK